MKNVFLKSLFAITCLLGSINASAFDFEVDGIYYDVVSLDELTCKVVSGNERYEGDIVIPATVNYGNRTLTVVEIANDAFKYASGLTGLTIPNTISSISDVSFYNGLKLEHVTIEDGETALSVRAMKIKTLYLGRNLLFRTSYSPFDATLKEVTIGNSVTKIDDDVFRDCSSLTNVTIPNSVTEIGNRAFWGCSDLTSMEIPNSVTKINDYAFYDCRGLTSVTIPNSVTEIGNSAFQNCSGLTSVAIGNSVTKIGDGAFSSCSNLKKVIVKDIAAWCGISFNDIFYSNPLVYAHHLYSDEETEITDLVIPNSVTKINDYAFSGCRGLTSVTIPNSVTEIGNSAFQNCSGLMSVTIGNSVTKIDDYVFQGCSSLTNVTIGSSVTTIENNVFENCDGLTTLYSLNPTPPSIGENNFTNKHYVSINVFVPQEALEAYQNADGWKDFWNLQGFDIAGIGNVKTENGKTVYYDLRGNRLNAPKRGVNIIKGKKMIMK